MNARTYTTAALVFSLSVHVLGQTITFPPSVTVSPAGSDGQIQYNNSGSLGAISKAVTNDTSLILIGGSTPSLASNAAVMFADSMPSSPNVKFRTTSGSYGLHPFRDVFFAKPVGNTTTVSQYGCGYTVFGTASNAIITSASWVETLRRCNWSTSATAFSHAGIRSSARLVGVGSSTPPEWGGFYFSTGIQKATSTATSYYFGGLIDLLGTPGGSTSLTGWANIIGIGHTQGDANWSIVANDASGTATQTSLGSNFPSTDFVWLEMACPPGGPIAYKVLNYTTGAVTHGTISTDIPASTAGLCAFVLTSNGSTASVCSITASHIYLEHDN